MLRLLATTSVLVLTLSASALAQTAPASSASFADRAATFAIRGAYHSIADAEARGASAYLDAAKTHYREALARLGRHDPGAAAEAMAATALARASVAAHVVPAPTDIPAPPALTATGPRTIPRGPVALAGPGAQANGSAPGRAPQTGRPQFGRPQFGRGPQTRGPQGPRGGRGPGAGGFAGRFDPTRLAADAKLANTAEARDLAQKAVDADVARTHAAFSGNMEEALRQGRIAGALSSAVRALALADHPPTFRRRPATAATVGLATGQ